MFLKYTHYKIKVFWALGLLLVSSVSCDSKKPTAQDQTTAEIITVTDDLGRKIKIPRYPKRVMGLAPSATEMLFAVCPDDQIIARTQNCDYPARALKKPVVNNYPLDYETLLQLKPDLIFTADGITPPEAAARLQELGIPVYFQKIEKVDEVFDRLKDIGRLMNREVFAEVLVDSLQRQLKTVQRKVGKPLTRPKVLAITWSDPIYVYGHNTIFTDKLRLIGAENAVRDIMDQPYPAVTREYILKINPDVLLGGSFGKMDSTFFKQYPELKRINAYQNRRIFAATDNLMSRPSPRVIESVRELQSFIQP